MTHPLLERIDAAVSDRVGREAVDFSGGWSKSSRRAYQSRAQLGSGSGPFLEIVDLTWRGAATCAEPIGGLAFLLTTGNLYWAKTPEISPTLSVQVSIHAYAESRIDRATFTASLGAAYLPGVPVPTGSDLAAACTIANRAITTGRIVCLAAADPAAFFVLLLSHRMLKMGRKRLWRVRDEVASSLPADVRELLTRRRSGGVPAGAGAAD